MIIVVLGATGNIGREVVLAAAADGHTVRAVSRSGRRPAGAPEGVEAVAGDMDDAATYAAALDGADAVFTLAGYRGLDGTLERLRAGGGRAVALLSSSAAPSGNRDNPIAAYNLDSEDRLAASGLAVTVVRPNAFASNALRWLPQLATGDVVREPFGDVALSVTHPADIAAVALHGLDGHPGTYRVSGPESLTAAERLAVLGDVLGRPLREEPMTDEQIRTEMSATTPQHYVDAFFDLYRAGGADETTVLSTVPDTLGRPARTFRSWCEEHAAEFG